MVAYQIYAKPKDIHKIKRKAYAVTSRSLRIHKGLYIKFAEGEAPDYFCRGEVNAEIELWKKLDPKDRKYFVPLLWWKRDEYVIQPQIKRTKLKGKKYMRVADEAWSKIAYLIPKYSLFDLDDDEWNWILGWNNEPFIFDYGQNEYNPDIEFSRPRFEEEEDGYYSHSEAFYY
jgi:hypothetical protein